MQSGVGLGRRARKNRQRAGDRRRFIKRSTARRPPFARRSPRAASCVRERLLAEGKNEKAAEIYDAVRKAEVPKQRILEATRGAIVARGTQGIPLLVEQLKSPTRSGFRLALPSPASFRGAEVAEALSAELAGATPERASLIVVALGDRGDATLPPAVLRAARYGDKQVRMAAIAGRRAIGRCVHRARAAGDCHRCRRRIVASREGGARRAAWREGERGIGRSPAHGERQIAGRTDRTRRPTADRSSSRVGEGARSIPTQTIRTCRADALGATVGPQGFAVLVSQVSSAKNAADAEHGRAGTASRLHPHARSRGDRGRTGRGDAERIDGDQSEPVASSRRDGWPEGVGNDCRGREGRRRGTAGRGTRVLGEWMTVDAAPVLLDIYERFLR